MNIWRAFRLSQRIQRQDHRVDVLRYVTHYEQRDLFGFVFNMPRFSLLCEDVKRGDRFEVRSSQDWAQRRYDRRNRDELREWARSKEGQAWCEAAAMARQIHELKKQKEDVDARSLVR
jgi:hypothetical protein